MRKVFVVLGLSLCYAFAQEWDGSEQINGQGHTWQSPEQFFYEQGYKDGYNKGYRLGYERAKQEVAEYYRRLLSAYKKDLMALEAGKYLYKENLITYPRVYRVLRSDGSAEIRIEGCRVEDIRDLEKLNIRDIPVISEGFINGKEIVSINEGVELPFVLKEKEGVVQPEGVILSFPLSAKKALDRQGIPYIQEKDKLTAVFDSRERLRTFCALEKVCRGIYDGEERSKK